MPKGVKRKAQNEQLTISEIYETIQARDFLQDLWWDLISDIKEKPTYKLLKSMVDDVVRNNLKNLSTKPIDSTEELRRQTTLTEISMMTYTVDTIISEVLYRKFENEYKSLVTKIIDEAQKENQSSSDKKSASVFENIERIFINDEDKGNNELKKEDIPSRTVASKTVVYGNIRKRGRPKKVKEEEMLVRELGDTNSFPPKRKRGRPRLYAVQSDVIEKKAKSINSQNSSETLNKKDNSNNWYANQESDMESEISIGDASDNVSSVHTSELSSFEDVVSVYSDDGLNGEKMFIPLRIANAMYARGKLPQIYAIRKKGEDYKFVHANEKSSNSSKSNSINVTSVSRPQRVRKPNLKYNNETMDCDVKDYSSSHADSGSSYSPEIKNPSASSSPRRQRKLKRRDRVPSNISVSKNSTKRYDSSDLYKPRSYNPRSTTLILESI